ncbi:coiled-coil domain-containing protein 25-like isoform X2 [Rhopilema esculentum]|uniref:coiled-coil domain-containing protein 25-like isoform X2 n=1 Tax=Rhopilema esculentum TaxID=499914 RepID=UPI0031DC3274
MFHVDKLSSAHIYLRMPEGMTVDDIPPDVLTDCAQLTKANSIQGCKMNDVAIVYTPWSNLKKTGDMDVGQVGFHKNKLVKRIMVEKKSNEIINRLNKTKVEEDPNFQQLREERDRKERLKQKRELQKMKTAEKELEKQKKEEEEARSYDRLMVEDKMTSNKDNADLEDDFM